MKVLLISLGLLLVSCTGKEDAPTGSSRNDNAETDNGSGSADGKEAKVVTLGDFEFGVKKEVLVSDAIVKSLAYSAESHSIKLSLGYAGCTDTKHSLIFSEICAQSYPAQCGAAVARPADFDSSCEALRHEELEIRLADSQNGMVLKVLNKDGKGLNVLVDRDGSVKAATTPP